MEKDASSPVLEVTHNYDTIEPYDKDDSYAHVALTGTIQRARW